MTENENVNVNASLLPENDSRGAEESVDHSDVLSHPMFAHFAKDKKGDIETICRDFRSMLTCASSLSSDILLTSKMTPCVSQNATPDLALTERQRMIARAAGMSYREYYTLVNDIPLKK